MKRPDRLLCIALCLAPGMLWSGELNPPRVFAAGSYPFGMAAADFNEDGRLDLAVANSNLLGQHTASVGVFLGNGDGTLGPMQTYTVGKTPRSVVAADLNGDGHTDLAVANQDGFVSILLGDGQGHFQPAMNFSAGPSPLSLAVGDFNHDNVPDLAVANFVDSMTVGPVTILLGNGDGTFQAPVEYDAGLVPQAIAVGDVNGDGAPDLLVACDGYGNIPGKLAVLLGNGDGTFGTAVHYSAGVNPFSIALGDFNGDGHLDVAIADETQLAIQVPLNDGHGAFPSAVPYSTGLNPFSVSVGDVNGDGVLDLIAANQGDGTVSVLLGAGDGTFHRGTAYSASLGLAPDASPQAVTLGDFNGDGHLDVAVANATLPLGAVAILTNTGSAVLLVSPTVLSYAGTQVGSSSPPASVTIRNHSHTPLFLRSIAISGADAGDFLESDTCARLDSGKACTVTVVFHPTAKGTRTAVLLIDDGAPDSPQQVVLRGTAQ
ncbi:MAG: FG-GAP-like repeat-containing protein [Bryobacteraceae bacterium]